MKDIMQHIFTAPRSERETVMFLEKGEVKDLLFPIERVESVTSCDGSIMYQAGADYVVEDGRLKVTEDSAIPCITESAYYNQPDSIIHAPHPATGEQVPLFWGEGKAKAWQVCVTYTHTVPWMGYTQKCRRDVYGDFLRKLADGEDVTLIFYGDSITWGANSSFSENREPMQGGYTMLFTQALADLYGYTVKYVDVLANPGGLSYAKVPADDYVAGERGTITYANLAIGGWTSQHGVDRFDETVKVLADAHGCDLFVIAFGMNDGIYPPDVTQGNVRQMADRLLEVTPGASLLLVSSMTPHTGTDWDRPAIGLQEEKLEQLAEAYREAGIPCAVACVHSVSKAVQTRKMFRDYTGNNVNHPNDWFYRVYVQTLLQAVVGYENMG